MRIRRSDAPTRDDHLRSRTRGILAIIAMPLVLGPAPHVLAEGAPAIPARLAALGDQAGASLERARARIDTGRLGDAVRAAAGLTREEVAPRSVSPIQVAVPSPIAGPVGELLGAVRSAETAAAEAVRDPLGLMQAHRELLGVLAQERGERSEVLQRRLGRFDRYAETVDQERLLVAGLTLAETLDRVLPALHGVVAALPPRPGGVAGCDVAEVENLLCVGGMGANTYVKDYALLVDLGGDDLHANSGGTADPLENGLSVSLALDLGGNDRYETAVPAASGARGAHGSGLVGGVGVLVDVAGDDRYTSTSVEAGAGQAYVVGGFGMLADLAGNDAYLTSFRGPATSPTQSAGGQGFASFAGAAIVTDQAGDDSYLIEHAPFAAEDEDGALRIGAGNALGFGYGILFGGVGLFSDGGGTDRMELRAVTGEVDAGERREVVSQTGGGMWANGFGLGIAGAGAAFGGAGPTTWVLHAESRAPRSESAIAQGFGVAPLAGFGGLADAGGDDAYLATALSVAEHEVEVQDGCACEGASAHADAGGAFVQGAGLGFLGGAGILVDQGGDDRYLHSARAVARADAVDGRESSEPGQGATALAETGGADALGQGLGSLGVGILEDREGDDDYGSHATTDAAAAASSTSGDVVESRAIPRDPGSLTQAASQGGLGILRDLGGSDRYESTARAAASAEPPTEIVPATERSYPQAAVFTALGQGDGGHALFADLDGVGTDVFVSVPAYPACEGTRGQGAWRDCGPGAGVGLNG